jgi:ABC-2 type transport system ATP-binding protein
MDEVICARELHKTYDVFERSRTLWEYLFNRKVRQVNAINGMDFHVRRGEIVGIIGKNGSGKSTIIKTLTGILSPTGGSVSVLGNDPFKCREYNTRHIGVVFGQKTQLWWEIPARDTFSLHKRIYKIGDAVFDGNLKKFAEVLEFDSFIDTPSRQLSLGQRVRLDIALSMLHDPEIIFLDEPTIGLDVLVKDRIRTFLRHICAERGTTLILTSHDMKDIEEICDRLIIIDKGKIIADGLLAEIKAKIGGRNLIEVVFEAPVADDIRIDGAVVTRKGASRFSIEYDDARTSAEQIINALFKYGKFNQMSFNDGDMDVLVKKLYRTLDVDII